MGEKKRKEVWAAKEDSVGKGSGGQAAHKQIAVLAEPSKQSSRGLGSIWWLEVSRWSLGSWEGEKAN